MTVRTIDEGLKRFRLVGSLGSERSNEACAMTLLAWVAGEEWTDQPQCAHPTLARLAIAGNIAGGATATDRERIVRAGEHGILDTWWVPTEVIVLEMAKVPRGTSDVDRAVAVAEGVAAWKAAAGPKVQPNLAGANLARAYLAGANLARADLADADLAGANLADADLAGANLAGANLTGAYLARANLAGADLADADLARANLTGADLAGADLADARGSASTKLPAGWKVNEAGLVVPA